MNALPIKKTLIILSLFLVTVGILLVTYGTITKAAIGTIWPSTTIPAIASSSDNQSVELGVKFRSTTAGSVTGVRFYKGVANTGIHTGSLWSSTGTQLATVTFTNETASGWQQALFATPVTIAANTTYVVSYHAPVGRYAYTNSYFANTGSTNGPLTALRSGTDGSNGVYKYGTAVAFPNNSYQSSNYWVDVVFSYGATTDTTRPTVSSVTPPANATNVATSSNVTASLSEQLDPATIAGSIELKNSAGTVITGATSYSATNNTITFDPSGDLSSGVTYTAMVNTTVKDLAGNALATAYVWNFTTAVAPPADTIAPTVSSVSPTANATNISTTSSISAVFSEALDNTTTANAIELKDSTNAVVTASSNYDATNRRITIVPSSPLASGVVYTATVQTSVKDVAGNSLVAPYVWSFTTANASVPATDLSQGTGGPVLLVNSSAKPFSKYYSEIMRAEGLNSFTASDISNLSASQLSQYSVVILGEVPVTDAQVTLLTDWVTAGGNLITMRPDKKLSGLLGITDQATVLNDTYLLIDTATAPGMGITDQTIQYHGPADAYSLQAGTRAVATLYSSATTATTYPAVTIRDVGTNGGQASAFTYDLAKSVIYTHQGNPAWVGQDRDGIAPIRANDLFFGAMAGDVQPDYVDLNKVAIPQADEQQRLLANTIAYVNQDRNPLPKFWYFPNNKKAVIVMAGDDHNSASGTQDAFNYMLANSPANCSVADWECIRATSWMFTSVPLTNIQASNYNAQGFELGVHVSTGCSNWTVASLDQAFLNDLAGFRSKYTSLPNQTTSRTHCIVWSDYVSSAIVEKKHGIRMDLNYYYWPGSWVQNRPGYFTGSGLNMRFADTDGTMIDVYQTPTHLVDESGQNFPAAINLQLDRALGPEGYYGALATHYDYSNEFYSQLIQSAVSRNVPLVSVKQMLDWTDGRNASSFTAPTWSGNTLNFGVTADSKVGSMLRGMLPISSVKGSLTSITKAGVAVAYTVETIKGVAYAIYPVTTGSYSALYSADTTGPTVTARTPAVSATGVDVTTSITATFNEPLDATTVTSSSVELRNSTNVLVPATVSYDSATSRIVLQPTTTLAPNTTFTAIIRGGTTDPRVKDVAGNALTSDVIWTFTTGTDRTSLWAPTIPTVGTATDDTARVELGVKFTSTIAGKISGITYYKSTNDATQHTVTLWNNAGVILGTATTTAETATGWQTALFTTPISIAANTTYTASYTAPFGQYSFTSGGLSSGYTNRSLSVPASGGVYTYGSGMPASSYNSTNYWVDVLFNP